MTDFRWAGKIPASTLQSQLTFFLRKIDFLCEQRVVIALPIKLQTFILQIDT
jgi:hypothetical protein